MIFFVFISCKFSTEPRGGSDKILDNLNIWTNRNMVLTKFEGAHCAHWKNIFQNYFNLCFWRIFDLDGDGFVSKKEFKWMTANKRVSQRKVDVMFEVRRGKMPSNKFSWFHHQRCDLNRDGRLDYLEFEALMLRNKNRKDAIEDRAKKALMRRKSSKGRFRNFGMEFSINE